MFVACSTLAFAQYPLDQALRTIAELDFSKVEVAIHEGGPHLRPSQVSADVAAALQQLRIGPGLVPGAFSVEIDAGEEEYQKHLRAVCRLARSDGGVLFAVSLVLHSIFDLPFHREDAHAHFFPFSDWRFNSPLSYWDKAHHAQVVFPLEVVVVAAASLVVWRRAHSPRARALLVAVNLWLWILGMTGLAFWGT